MKALSLLLGGLFILLQMKLWWGDGSIRQVRVLQREVSSQEEKVETLKSRNQLLEAEVQDLKYQLSALEEKARTGLGMIRKGETFYQYSMDDP